MAEEYKQLTCSDSGAECGFQVRAETEDEVIAAAKGHAQRIHGIAEVPEQMEAHMRELVKTVTA